MLKKMQIWVQDVDLLIFADADIYFQYLWMPMLMLKIMRISVPPLVSSMLTFSRPLDVPVRPRSRLGTFV